MDVNGTEVVEDDETVDDVFEVDAGELFEVVGAGVNAVVKGEVLPERELIFLAFILIIFKAPTSISIKRCGIPVVRLRIRQIRPINKIC